MSNATVFISYSHDSPEHSERVLELAWSLRGNGIDVELDQFHNDRTVFSAATLAKLRLQRLTAQEGISGLGGSANSVIVETQIRLTRETSSKVFSAVSTRR